MNTDMFCSHSESEHRDEAHVSPIWQAAIDKYYEELKKGGVDPKIEQDLWSTRSPNELLQQIQDLSLKSSQSPGNWLGCLRRLEPIILNLSDFVAVITLAVGMNGQLAAVIWGSIRLILKVDFFQPFGCVLTQFANYNSSPSLYFPNSWICLKS